MAHVEELHAILERLDDRMERTHVAVMSLNDRIDRVEATVGRQHAERRGSDGWQAGGPAGAMPLGVTASLPSAPDATTSTDCHLL